MEKLSSNLEEIVDLHLVIQGEGRDVGFPAILVRFSRCNMNCQFKDGICDSAYTSWNPEKGKYSLKDIEDLILQNPHIKYTFITGGNPSYNHELLKEVVQLFKKHNFYVAIEDNGTLFTDYIEGIDFVSLSPKLKNSVPIPGTVIKSKYVNRVVSNQDRVVHEKYRTRYDSIKKWIDNYDYQLKFVVSEESQLEEIESLIDKIGADRSRVWLMPEGVNKEQLNKRRKWLVELAIKTGYKYTDRLHIITYGNKRQS